MRDLAGPARRLQTSALSIPLPMTYGVVLAFDFGARRIGVAIGNGVTREARPLATVAATRSGERWDAVARLVAEWQPERLVVGVPRHPDGAAHEMTARCERFARQLCSHEQLEQPIGRHAVRRRGVIEERGDLLAGGRRPLEQLAHALL